MSKTLLALAHWTQRFIVSLMSSHSRATEIFLTCCLDGDINVITRILKKHKIKSWPGRIGSNHFDINGLDGSRRSGLILATISGLTEVVDMLLSRSDLDVNVSDMFGCTALMYASKLCENLDILKLLLERKDLDLDGKDDDGKTAEMFAQDVGNGEAVRLIRAERCKRMGRDWTLSSDDTDGLSEEIVSSENEEDEISQDFEDLSVENDSLGIFEAADDFLKLKLQENFQERFERAKQMKEKSRIDFEQKLDILRANKERKIEDLQNQISKAQEEFQETRKIVEEDYSNSQRKLDDLIEKLEKAVAVANFNIDQIFSSQPQKVSTSTPCSELECPICLEEMRPPIKIWQCVSGHPVCDVCMRSPRVKDCPTCRQRIVGRNVLAEKLAKSMYEK